MAPSNCLNQCWNIVDWTFRNKLCRNFIQNHLNRLSAKWWPFCLCFNVLHESIHCGLVMPDIDLDYTADSRLAPSRWETSLQSNAVSHWLAANLESSLNYNLPSVRHQAITWTNEWYPCMQQMGGSNCRMNNVNVITRKALDGLFSNLAYT